MTLKSGRKGGRRARPPRHSRPKSLHGIRRTKELIAILRSRAGGDPVRMDELQRLLDPPDDREKPADPKTIRGYIDWLNADGYVIEFKRPWGWQLDLHASDPKSDLGKIEREAVRQSALALKVLRDLGFEAPGHGRTAREAIAEQLAPDERFALSSVFTRFRVDTWPRRELPAALDAFAEAVRRRCKLRLKYRPETTKAWSTKTIDPCLLRWIGDRWELLAFDPDKGDIRTFLPSRARNVEVLASEPADPHKALLDQCMREIFRTIRGSKGSPEVEVVVRFEKDAARFIEGATFHPSQKTEMQADGGLVLRLRVTTLREVVPWLLGLGAGALALEPPELRTEMAAALRAALARYEPPLRDHS